MRIWIAADISSASAGGVMRSMRELSVALKKRGHVVKIITRQRKEKGNYLAFTLQLGIRLLLSVFNRPDWVIARSTDGFFCALFAKLFRMQTRVALHSHGWEEFAWGLERKMPRGIVDNPTRVQGLMVRFPLLRFTLQLSSLVVNGTLHETERLRKAFSKHAEKIVYVPNGVTSFPSPHWVEASSRPLTFLCVGNSSWKKNVRHALRVFTHIREEHPEARLICAGTGVDDEAFAAVFGVAKPSGVVNMPVVRPEEMDQWYRESPYMLMMSRYEGGHPFALLEALAHGVVVFAAAIPSITEILHDGVNGFLLNAVSPEEDAQRILRIIDGQTDLDIVRTAAAGSARVYDWREISAGLEKHLCRT